MSELLDLSAHELLTTTRAVRKRLDLHRPVPDDVIMECIATAQQSPSGSNNPTVQFVIVRDADKRRAIGEIYGQVYAMYKTWDGIYIGSIAKGDDTADAVQQQSAGSADWLGEHMGDAPVLVIPCNVGMRTDAAPSSVGGASAYGNVLPAMWSFMLAARLRGLGTAWTTLHLVREKEVADILGIPFDTVQQMCLSPLAYTLGTDFKVAHRPDPSTLVRWDGW